MAKKDRRTPARHTHAQYGALFIWEQTAQGKAEVEPERHITAATFFFINLQQETLGVLHVLHLAWNGQSNGQRLS